MVKCQRFTAEFKAEVVRLLDAGERLTSEIAIDLGRDTSAACSGARMATGATPTHCGYSATRRHQAGLKPRLSEAASSGEMVMSEDGGAVRSQGEFFAVA